MSTMTSLLVEILGSYTQLPGEGLASVNWPWIFSAIIWVLLIWFVFKLILRLIERSSRRP